MAKRITLGIKKENQKALESDKPLLGNLLASLTLKDDYAGAKNSKELLDIFRNKKATK